MAKTSAAQTEPTIWRSCSCSASKSQETTRLPHPRGTATDLSHLEQAADRVEALAAGLAVALVSRPRTGSVSLGHPARLDPG